MAILDLGKVRGVPIVSGALITRITDESNWDETGYTGLMTSLEVYDYYIDTLSNIKYEVTSTTVIRYLINNIGI